MNSVSSNDLSLKYQRSKPSGCKNFSFREEMGCPKQNMPYKINRNCKLAKNSNCLISISLQPDALVFQTVEFFRIK